MKAIAIMFAAALALVLQGAFATAQAVNASGHCTGLTVTDFVSSDDDTITNSATFVNVPDGHLNFTTSSTGCVMITFSGLASANPMTQDGSYSVLRVRTLLDGSSLCVPALTNDAFMAVPYPPPEAVGSITRICKIVASGAHTVQVQYRVETGQARFEGHVLTVTHN